MILEIVIRNFRSVGAEQIISFGVKDSRGGNIGNVVELPGSPYFIAKSIGLYGANGSGKTNALRAIWTARKVIAASYSLGEGESIPWYDPCIFYGGDDGRGSSFEIEFTIPIQGTETRFLYKTEFDENEFIYESLSSFAKGREAVLFTRKLGDDKDSMTFGASMRGGDRKVAFFKNQAYLSVAGRNPTSPEFIRRIYRYFKNGLTQIRLNENGPTLYNPRNVEAQRLVRFVDLGITDMSVRKMNVDESSISFPKDMPSVVREQLLDRISRRYYFRHIASKGVSGDIDLEDESDGTQKLFSLFPGIVRTLVNGGVYIIDEIESGMHPFMAEAIVRLFNESELNHGQAQLIFTTHNSNLLSSAHMRRDQIWFAEKVDGCSRFYSLDDFDKKMVTPSSPFAKWYLEGRFGAIPSIDYTGLVQAIKSMQQKEADDARAE